MFSAECPKCKNEIPLGVTDCPVCAAKEAAGESSAETPILTPPPQVSRAAPDIPAVRRATPAWLVMLGVAVALGAIFALGYLVLLPKMRNGTATEQAKQAPPAQMESPGAPATAAPAAHRYAKHIEVAGIRIVEENKKPVLKMLLVNHSGAELPDVAGKVELRATNAAPGAAAIGVIEVSVPSLGPYESKELSAPLKTALRAYELPDWQFLRAALAE